jgi:hypothetical protein
MSYERYIVTSGSIFGHYGYGATLEVALRQWRKAGGKKKEGGYRVQKFVSDKPFAPVYREATEAEADCWIGRDGSVNWIR